MRTEVYIGLMDLLRSELPYRSLIVFLTAASSRSETVQSEVRKARDYKRVIIPVRAALAEELPYPLSACLARFNTRNGAGRRTPANFCKICSKRRTGKRARMSATDLNRGTLLFMIAAG
jgi:hypothetical protein